MILASNNYNMNYITRKTISFIICYTFITVRSMKTSSVTPTASRRFSGNMKPQKLVWRSYPAHKMGGARVIVKPPSSEPTKITMTTGITGRAKLTIMKNKWRYLTFLDLLNFLAWSGHITLQNTAVVCHSHQRRSCIII